MTFHRLSVSWFRQRRDVESQRRDVTEKAKMKNFEQGSKVWENTPIENCDPFLLLK